MKRIAIFGKSSYLGNNFADYLKNDNNYIIDKINSRDGEWENMDFSQYDVVYFVAGIAHRNMKKTEPQLYYDVNTTLAYNVAKKSKNSGVKQFIMLSSIAVFGIDGELEKECNITSNVKENANTPYGDSKLNADNLIIKMNELNFRVVIVRPPMVYGKNCKGNFARLESLSKKFGIFPNFENERSMIYVKNLDEFIKLCIDNEVDGIFYPQNKDYVSTCDMYTLLRSVNGKKTWCPKIFNFGIHLIGNKIRLIKKLLGNNTIDKSMSNTFDFKYAKYNLAESIEDISKQG